MLKPFDRIELQKRLEKNGVTAAEKVAEIIVVEVLQWVEDSCMIHENSIVRAIGAPAVKVIRPLALQAVDQIDGKKNQ